jgi:lauroyl/myristoyl acyltransferase
MRENRAFFLPFLGQLAFTLKGSAFFFAIRTGSSIITAFRVCRKGKTMKMKIEELSMSDTDEEKDIEIINSVPYY